MIEDDFQTAREVRTCHSRVALLQTAEVEICCRPVIITVAARLQETQHSAAWYAPVELIRWSCQCRCRWGRTRCPLLGHSRQCYGRDNPQHQQAVARVSRSSRHERCSFHCSILTADKARLQR